MSSIASLPSSEPERLARLRELFILDTAPEPVFDEIAQLAAEACATPMALLVLVDGERQWFKARVGVGDTTETPRDIAFCAHAILGDEMMVVPDLALEPRFAVNPQVAGQPGVRFYAAAPLVLPCGERVGTLCVLDTQPRLLDERQLWTLRSLASLATKTLLMRRDLMAQSLADKTQAEKTLAAALDEMADLYDNAPCGYHSLDAQGRFLRINNAELRWLGCTREEVVGKRSMSDFLTDDGRALFRENFPRLMRDGQLENLEFDLVGRSGQTRRVIATATAIKDAQGAAVATRTVSYDITELQRTRDALRRLTGEQQAMLDTDLIGILKIRGRTIVWANRGAERLFGYGPGELANLPNRLLYPDEAHYRHTAERAQQDTAAGRPFSLQGEAARKDGQRFWVDVRGMVQPEDPGTVLCMVVDITAAKRAEEARVHAVALEVENRQLAEVNRVKGVFLSNMSHELRTPLNAVIGYTHLLQAGTVRPDSPKFGHYLGQIGSSGRQLLGLIDTVLNFAEVDAGAIELKRERVSLKSGLQNAIASMWNESLQKGIFLALEMDPTLDEVVTDEMRLNQMVTHYLSNAIKFSHSGGSVTVRAWPETETDFRIEVEDSGIGIAEDEVPRLFTPFRQISEGHTKVYPGAGLGLALTRRLAQAQGGSTGVHSRLGVGSVFWIVLPREGDRADPPA